MRIDLPVPELSKSMIEEAIKETVEIVPTGISLDSREVKPGDLFIAIKGEHVDGHDFLTDAREQGCVAALVDNVRREVDLPQIVVKNPATVIANLAEQWRSSFSIPILGITGTNGKTTTKDLLIHILSAAYHVHGTRGNYNTKLGLPLTLLELTSHHTLSILEMGANQRGDIGYLCNISQPRYGLITNIAPAHLQDFGSIENISKSKGELFEALPPDGIAFVNAEDERIKLLPTEAKRITYGFDSDCDFTADLHQNKESFLSLTINGHEISLNSYSRTFAKNTLAACAVSISHGISWESFQESILSFVPTKGRCQIKDFHGVTIIDDTYNSNLTSTLEAMELLFSLPTSGNRIVVFGDMLELGNESETHHQRVGNQCITSKVDLLLCYGYESQTTVDTAKSRINARHFLDKGKLAETLKEEVQAGDTILFKGSRGMALETIIEEVFSP